MASYLLDTNVLLRLANRADPQHNLCCEAIRKLRAAGHRLCIAPQVLIEFWVVTTRPPDQNGYGWDTQTATRHVSEMQRLFELCVETPQLFGRWLSLVSNHQIRGKRSHDVRIVALIQLHSVDFLLTFNQNDFRNLPVTTVAPSSV